MKKLYNECPNGQMIELFFWFLPSYVKITQSKLIKNFGYVKFTYSKPFGYVKITHRMCKIYTQYKIKKEDPYWSNIKIYFVIDLNGWVKNTQLKFFHLHFKTNSVSFK